MSETLPFRDYFQLNRDAIDRLEEAEMRGAGREFSRGERLQVIELLHRLAATCPHNDRPVAQWKCPIPKLQNARGRRYVSARTIQRWVKLAEECGLVARSINVLERGGSEWNTFVVDWQAIRGEHRRSTTNEDAQEAARDAIEAIEAIVIEDAIERASCDVEPPKREATRCDTTRHGVASRPDTVSGPTPPYVPKDSYSPPPPSEERGERPKAKGQREEAGEGEDLAWRTIEDELRNRLKVDFAAPLVRTLRSRGVPPAMVADWIKDRRDDGTQGRLVVSLREISPSQVEAWLARQRERAKREAERNAGPTTATPARVDRAAAPDPLAALSEAEIAALAERLDPINRRRWKANPYDWSARACLAVLATEGTESTERMEGGLGEGETGRRGDGESQSNRSS